MWTKAITPNDADMVKANMTPNLTYRSVLADVDANANSINQTFGTNIVRVNSDGTADTGIQFIFDYLEIGAVVEIECEMRVISGATPILKLSEWNTSTLAETYPQIKSPTNTGEWKIVRFKKPISFLSATYNHRAFIGLPSGSAGIYELRITRATAFTKQNITQEKVDRGFYKYNLKKTAGTWALDSGSFSSGATLAAPLSSSLELTFPTKYKPTVQISSSNNRATIGWTYNNTNKITMNCRYIKDDASISSYFSDIPDGAEIHITIFYKL